MIEQWHCDYQYQTFTGENDTYPYTSSADCQATATSSATTTAAYINGFSYGEALIAFLLFNILVMMFFKALIDRSLGVRVQKIDNYN